jgi:hypothetical protein
MRRAAACASNEACYAIIAAAVAYVAYLAAVAAVNAVCSAKSKRCDCACKYLDGAGREAVEL